jgi:glucose-6-phosphate-specific signal transduction histidine kinase
MAPLDINKNKRVIYEASWLAYILFTLTAFSVFSITVMLFSITLTIVGAWLYGYRGWLATTALTIPYHYVMLIFNSDDPGIWIEAFNLIGITTQLSIAGLIVLLKSKDKQLRELNILLENKVEERINELNKINHYLLASSDSERKALGHSVLNEINTSLLIMLDKYNKIENHLRRNQTHIPRQFIAMRPLINDSINSISHMDFVHHFALDDPSELKRTIRKLASHYKASAGTEFEIDFEINDRDISSGISPHFYRIIHESVTNAIKHAQAKKITIRIGLVEEQLQLSVMNDGKSMQEIKTEGMGIKLMRHRAHILKGSIVYEDHIDGGTKMICTVPNRILNTSNHP